MNAFDSLPEPLTPAEETALSAAKNFETLALHNVREAVVYMRKVTRGNVADDELISTCYGALLRSARRFKPEYGLRFFAFAKAALRGDSCRSWRAQAVVRGGECESLDTEGDEAPHDEADLGLSVEPEFGLIDFREHWGVVKGVLDEHCDEHERIVLGLTYDSGFSFAEIGRLLSVSRCAITATHTRALRKIRCALLRRQRLLSK